MKDFFGCSARVMALLALVALSLDACSSDATNPTETGGSAGAVATGGTGGGTNGPCGLGTLCVQPAPLGWTGPVAVWQGAANAAPACPAPLSEKITGYADVTWPPAKCTACQCDTPSTEVCSADLTLGALACDGAALHLPDSSCKSIAMSGGGTLNYAQVTTRLSDGVCQPQPATPVATVPSSGNAARACAGIEVSSASCAGQCVYAPPAPFGAVCIYASGDVPCPSGEYAVRSVYQTFDDQRACGTCNCGPSDGGKCSAAVGVYTDNAQCGTLVASVTDGACTTLSPDISVPVTISAKITQWDVSQPGTCQPGGGQPQGQFVAADKLTLCCEK